MGPVDTPRNTLYIPERAGVLLFSCVGVGLSHFFLLRWLTPHPLLSGALLIIGLVLSLLCYAL